MNVKKPNCGSFYIFFWVCLISFKVDFNLINHRPLYEQIGITVTETSSLTKKATDPSLPITESTFWIQVLSGTCLNPEGSRNYACHFHIADVDSMNGTVKVFSSAKFTVP